MGLEYPIKENKMSDYNKIEGLTNEENEQFLKWRSRFFDSRREERFFSWKTKWNGARIKESVMINKFKKAYNIGGKHYK